VTVIEPRLMTKAQAASYCGVTPSGFTAWIKAGIVPGPLPGTQRYDRKALDAALDRHSGLSVTMAPDAEDDPLEKWLRENGHPADQGPRQRHRRAS
jgi:hypothetical protein